MLTNDSRLPFKNHISNAIILSAEGVGGMTTGQGFLQSELSDYKNGPCWPTIKSLVERNAIIPQLT